MSCRTKSNGTIPGYRALCNAVLRGKTGYSCETLRNFSKRLDAAAKESVPR